LLHRHGMRLLMVTHGPLTGEFGASQVALNLAGALRELGHEVIVWTPHPLPTDTHWWQTLRAMRQKVNEFLETQQRFDLIECPATLVTRRVSEAAPVIVRSTQPDILYLRYNLRKPTADIRRLMLLPFEYAYTLWQLWLVLQGWRRAQNILCLGTVELRWMQRWFPWWRRKLGSYVNALSPSERVELAKISKQRTRGSNDSIRFLWIGRWSAHKGPDVLIKFIRDWTKARPRDTFTIAGCGSGVEKEFPIELLRSGVITLVPSFKRSELGELLAQHHIGLFTSKVEGWGLSLNEMLESGMVVYATQAGGVSDLRPYHESLLEFPPEFASISVKPISNSLNAYYDNFNWPHIADAYLRSINCDVSNPLERVPDPLAQQPEAST
jgi:glycosyltransferase involved in cell wall biosynthesis